MAAMSLPTDGSYLLSDYLLEFLETQLVLHAVKDLRVLYLLFESAILLVRATANLIAK